MSVNELYELLRKTSGKDLLPAYGPAKPGEQLRSCVDASAASHDLGWYPETGHATGLEEPLSFFEALER